MVLRLRGSDAAVIANDAATFYRLASDGNTDAVEVHVQALSRSCSGCHSSDYCLAQLKHYLTLFLTLLLTTQRRLD